MGNEFNIEGGRELTTIGASWFVSYSYYENIDKTHKNWTFVSTADSRASTYYNSKEYHKIWLNEVAYNMSENKLSKNKIELDGYEVKKMAKILLGDEKQIPQSNNVAKLDYNSSNTYINNDNESLIANNKKEKSAFIPFLIILAAAILYYYFK